MFWPVQVYISVGKTQIHHKKIETTIVACKKIKYGGWKTGSNYNFEIA